MAGMRLPYGRHCIEDDDIAAVVSVLKGETLTGGPAVAEFEVELAARCAVPHAVACANGTAALHLAALTLGLGPGDAAIVPAITFLATANAARYVGAEVIFADVDPDSGLMTPDTLAAALRSDSARRAKAMFPVHLAGHSADMPALRDVAAQAKLAVVEDACHALGGDQADGQGGAAPIGSCKHSEMATFSFHPVKTAAMGEGGAVTTRNPDYAERLRRLRNHGMVRELEHFEMGAQAFDGEGRANPWHYEMPEPGYNYRASDINCALGLSQLRKLDRFLGARAKLASVYDALLSEINAPIRPVTRANALRSGWHLYVVLIDFAALGKSRAEVMRALAADGIGTQVHYIPVCHQPYYRNRYGAAPMPGADTYFARALTLPLFPAMTESDVAFVVAKLRRALGT